MTVGNLLQSRLSAVGAQYIGAASGIVSDHMTALEMTCSLILSGCETALAHCQQQA